jgi:hypothetical protein
VRGCSSNINCPVTVVWTDKCHTNAAGIFTETVTWGDGTPPETLAGASQGCFLQPCAPGTFSTSYLALLQHVFTTPGTKVAKVEIADTLNPVDGCTVKFDIFVDQ